MPGKRERNKNNLGNDSHTLTATKCRELAFCESLSVVWQRNRGIVIRSSSPGYQGQMMSAKHTDGEHITKGKTHCRKA